MKKFTFFLFGLIISSTMAAQKADDIIGIWYNEEKDSKIKIYKKGDEYFGKVIWIKRNTNDDGSTPRSDRKNPDEKLRNRPIVGMNILTDLEWDAGDREWDEGDIYDPKSGNTYSMYARLKDPDTLFLKGYIGFSLIGRSTLWTRVKQVAIL